MRDVVIASAARTAIGGFGKSLRDVPTTELGATAARAAIERARLEPEQVDQVVFGNVIHSAPEDMYMARVVGDQGRRAQGGARLHRQPPVRHRACRRSSRPPRRSSRRRRRRARRRRRVDEPRALLDAGARWGARMGDAAMVDPVVGGLTDPFDHDPHGRDRGEPRRVARDLPRGPGRVRGRVASPRGRPRPEEGRFDERDRPRRRSRRKSGTVEFTRDEHIRHDISAEALAKLKPVFKHGRHRHRRQRLRHQRRRRGGRLMSADTAAAARRARARADPLLRLLRRRPEDHGHRARARRAQGARARRHARSTTST